MSRINNKNSFVYFEEKEKVKLNKALISVQKLEGNLKIKYKNAMEKVLKEITFFATKYANNNNLTYEEVNKSLTSKEIREFRRDLKTYIKFVKKIRDETLLSELNILLSKKYISRLEAFFYYIDKIIDEIIKTSINDLQILLSDTLKENNHETMLNFNKYMDEHINFIEINEDVIEDTLEYPWSGNNFQSIMRNNRTKLKNTLKKEIIRMIIQGYTLKETFRFISNQFNTSYKSLLRIIHTEHARIMSEASKFAYITLGVEKYQIVAILDEKTSDICRHMDGKVFNFKDGVIGKNIPPLHPYCRSAIIPIIDDENSKRSKRYNKPK